MAETRPSNKADFLLKVGEYTPDQLKVVRFSLQEDLSDLFRLTLEIVSPKRDLDFDKILGQPALLTIDRGGEKRFVNGLVSRFEQGERYGEKMYGYCAEVVPKAWLLKGRQKCRIFQNLSVAEIIEKVLQEAGLSGDQVQMTLKKSPPKREFCVQYRESDFVFISRLMEQQGLFYFFRHTSSNHTLVIADDSSTINKEGSSPKVIFRGPGTAGVSAQEHISLYHYHRVIGSGRVRLRDFNFKKVALDLEAEASSDAYTDLETYDYPGEYETQSEGQALAKIRLEEHLATRRLGSGQSDCRRFMPGCRFVLEDHPRGDFNREYLLIGVSHSGNQPQSLGPEAAASGGDGPVYENQFQCIPSDVPFRPPQVAPQPVIQGPQTALVVGPAGEEIYTDEYGRVKVQFHWDREGKQDQKSSCWLRVAQAWAGAGWGGLFIPRIGQEVVVSFIEGDPDRPIVIGAVYNGANKPPYPLPDEKTRSTIKTNSSLGGDGFNEIRFEDAKGSEEIYIHGEKDWTIAIKNDKNQTVGNDETRAIGHDQSQQVGHDKTMEVGRNHTEKIGANMSLTVGSNKTELVLINSAEAVGAAKEITVGGIFQITVGGAMNETVAGAKAEEVGAFKGETVGGNKSEAIGGNRSLKTGGSLDETMGKNRTVKIGADLTETVGGKHTETVTKEYEVHAKKVQLVAEDQLTLKAGDAQIVLKKSGDIEIKGKKIQVKGSGNVIIKGSKILENG